MKKTLLLSIAVFVFFATAVSSAANPQVVMETNYGDITLELYPEEAPVTVNNFLSYVNSDFYDGLIFHRVIENFVIQGGGYYYNGDDGKFYLSPTLDPIINESDNGLSNLRGTLGMARTSEVSIQTCRFIPLYSLIV